MQKSTNLWKSLRRSENLFLQLKQTPKCHRTFLSKAYHCEEAWEKRLNSSLLQKINSSDMFIELDRKFLKNKLASAIDVDIYVNIVDQKHQIEEITDLIRKLRVTTETSKTLPSTHHAVIRFFLKFNHMKQLLDILDDRLTYGIFPDHLCYNLLMDTAIKKKDFASAAKVASLLMLQEDFENPIANALALYSCDKYLENPGEWKAKEIVKDEPVEEVKVRVVYIRNPYFDDHFDLLEPSDLAGKTLALYGKHVGGPEGRSCQLRGLILYKKYANAVKLIEDWIIRNENEVVHKDVLSSIKKDVGDLFEGELSSEVKKLQDLLLKLESMSLKQENLTEILENNIKTIVEKQEKIDISRQCKEYEDWEEKRMIILQEHLVELDKREKMKQFAEIKKQLIGRERILTYFDNEEKIELEIEAKLKKEETMYGKIHELSVVSNEDYIPPEVSKRKEI